MFDQLGRLRAGPLEDLDGAIQAYRQALALEPERAATRAALAQLLSHRPPDWPEALAQHRAALEADPTLAASLRAVLRIAEGSGQAEAAAHGRAILRALGAVSAAESRAPAALARPLAASGKLDDPLAETLRQLAQQAAAEIAEALDSSPGLRGLAPRAARWPRSAPPRSRRRAGSPRPPCCRSPRCNRARCCSSSRAWCSTPIWCAAEVSS